MYSADFAVLRNYGFVKKQLHMWTENMTFGYSTTSTSTPNRMFEVPLAEISGYDYTWLGLLGIDGRPTNLSDHGGQDAPINSLLHSMKAAHSVPSRSWGYTAGSFNRKSSLFKTDRANQTGPLGGTPGSLVLGGYDKNKFIDNKVRFPFHDDDEVALTVNLRSMTLRYGLSEGFAGFRKATKGSMADYPALIDSNRPYMILPPEWCADVANILKLAWDNSTKHYLISDQLHEQLTAENPRLEFTISPRNLSNETVTIILPYTSLGLGLRYPILNSTAGNYYFPMLPANNTAEYTLGRAFLQDAYIISDYHRKEFQVKQVDWDNPNFSTSNIVPIFAPGEEPSNDLGPAGIGGITAALVLVSAFFVLLILLFRRAGHRLQLTAPPASGKEEDDGSSEPSSPRSPNTSMSPGDKIDGKVVEIDSRSIHESGGNPILPLQEMEEVQISELPDMTGTLARYYREAEIDSSELYVADRTPASTKITPESRTTKSTLTGSARTKSSNSSGTNTLSNPATAATLDAGAASPIPQTPAEFYGGRQLPDWRLADRKEAALLRGHERSAAAARGKKSAFTEAVDDDDRPPASPIPQTPAEYYGRAVDLRPAAGRPAGDSLPVPAARLAPPPPLHASPIPQTPPEYYGGGGRGPPTGADGRGRSGRATASAAAAATAPCAFPVRGRPAAATTRTPLRPRARCSRRPSSSTGGGARSSGRLLPRGRPRSRRPRRRPWRPRA